MENIQRRLRLNIFRINLGDSVNSPDFNLDPFIAPDECYTIFVRVDWERKSPSDLFISFRQDNGDWTGAINMAERINSNARELCPTVSPDGKYFFFSSNRIVAKHIPKFP